MKIKAIILSIVASITLGFGFSSCSDMLSPDSERHSYEVAGDTLYSYWGILRSMQNVAERYIVLGECRGDLVAGTSYLSDSIKAILDFDMNSEYIKDGPKQCRFLKASDYYHIINSCNAYLASADSTLKTGTNQPYMMKEFAQVEAIRAWTYLQLVQVYGEVPFYTEPLLTTDKINNFINNPNHKTATTRNLADLLEPFLTRALAIENQYGFPSYEKYGYTANVCHSTKCMIPLNIILGDLYLAKGKVGEQDCFAKAAQYYYNYLSNTQGRGHIAAGGALPYGYNYMGFKGESSDKAIFSGINGGIAWTETGAQNRTQESITAIPSSTNKLWGTVLRGVNELFGYSSEISVRTDENDSTTSASIFLTPQYDVKQLVASGGYFAQCKAQEFEIAVGTVNGQVNEASLSPLELTVDPEVGDARQYWVKDVMQQYENGLTNTEKFITKQNPNGGFTTVYPMIYRKSMIWLRFAEALNRAGYPSYAFAILKDGLCKNSTWYPNYQEDADCDFAVKDSAYIVKFTYAENTGEEENGKPIAKLTEVTYPELNEGEVSPYRTKAEIMAAVQPIIDEITSKEGFSIFSDPLALWTPISFENYIDKGNAVLYYLDKRECEKSPEFLNFDFNSFAGNYSSFSYPYRTSLIENRISTGSVSYSGSGDDKATVGIHSRGCGLLCFTHRLQSNYDYVKLIQKAYINQFKPKRPEDVITKQQIYSGTYDDIIQNYIEDLIVNEEAMELAFEGTRFFDLMRVADRRDDPSYLAEKVSCRTGEKNNDLYDKLRHRDSWFFPLPQK